MAQDKPTKTHTGTSKPEARELDLNELETVSGCGHKAGKGKAEFVVFRLSSFSGGPVGD